MSDKENLLKVATTAVHEDPTIVDPSRIVLSITRRGRIFRKKTLVKLDGTVRLAPEVKKVENIVRRKLPDVGIENNLVPSNNDEL